MEKPKLPVKEFLAHLRRQSIPEIISDECLAAFSNVEEQYGEELTRVSGFEVRLGSPARYVDYILTVEEKNIPFEDFIWYEIDYEQFAAEKKIEPCFSMLKAFMGGSNTRQNPNRGINRGCTAGRNHFCVTAAGKFSPCNFIPGGQAASIADYLEKSSTLKNFRALEENHKSICKNCCYKRRCLPCPALKIQKCPLEDDSLEK